jgi:uncharacterized heparinase superfamily protein
MVASLKLYWLRLTQLPPRRWPGKIIGFGLRQIKELIEETLTRLQLINRAPEELDPALVDPLREPQVPELLKENIAKRFFITPAQREAIVTVLRKVAPEAEKQIIIEADRICDHIFDLLGSGPTPLGEKIDWHVDFKTGHRWNPRTYYKRIRPASYPGGYDIKVPWELSRCQHFVRLGQAYWITGDEKYAREFVAQVEDWIASNPWPWGVNWACTMDVAIRAVNWLWGLAFFLDSPSVTDEFLLKIARSLFVHGRHIMNNLEGSGEDPHTTNHYIADLVGLVYLGICCPYFKEAEKWRDFALRELVREMEKQVYPDGFDFEASTCYHRLVLEFFFYTAVLCQRNGIDLPQAFWDRLYKMFEVVLYILKPNGRLPQLGDNDSGRLFVLHPREVLDGTYLLSYAAIFFQDSNFKLPRFGLAPEAIWLFGPEGAEKWQALPPRSEPLGSKAFPNAGVYVMRHKDDYMLISCGPNGQNDLGGHAHNDKLSFELCIGGEEVIVDPGTCVYTPSPEWRNHFRSTACHNTIVVDGQEQNPVERDVLFRLSDLTRCRCLVWETGPEKDVFVGEHYGYLRLDPPVVHRRKVEFSKNERTWVITDYLYQPPDLTKESASSRASRSQQTHLLEFNLHLAPGVEVSPDFTASTNDDAPGVDMATPMRNSHVVMAGGQATLVVASGNRAPDPGVDQSVPMKFRLSHAGYVLDEVQAWGWSDLRCETGWYSPEYGRREKVTVVGLWFRWPASVDLRL